MTNTLNPASNFFLVNGNNGVSVGGLGTGIMYFPANAIVNLNGLTTSNLAYLPIPQNMLNGQQFTVKAGGNFEVGAGGTCPAVTIGLYPVTYVGTTPTIGSTAIISYQSTLQNNDSVFYPWAINVEFSGDTATGLVQQCNGSMMVDGTNTNLTAGLVTGLSGINFSNPVPFGFIVGAQFSVSEAGNLANLYQFALDYVNVY
jgi:hypothetical protein